MSRDINPFGLRMPTDLREAIEREARINGRSLNSEIVGRLKGSLLTAGKPAVFHTEEDRRGEYNDGLTDIERQLLTIFRRLPVEKQLALLSLFK